MDTEFERPRWRFTANYGLHRRLQVGIEYNPAAGEVGPLASIFLLTETERQPALFLGTSSDRIGSPEGAQSYYLTAAKLVPRLPLGVYGSVNYSEWDTGWNFPFGAALEFGYGITPRYMYDGERSHLLLQSVFTYFGVTLMWVWIETFGVSLFAGF